MSKKLTIFILATLQLQIFCSSESELPIKMSATPTPSLESIAIQSNEQSALLQNQHQDSRYAALEQALRKAKKIKATDNKKLIASISTIIAMAIFTVIQHYKLCESN